MPCRKKNKPKKPTKKTPEPNQNPTAHVRTFYLWKASPSSAFSVNQVGFLIKVKKKKKHPTFQKYEKPDLSLPEIFYN